MTNYIFKLLFNILVICLEKFIIKYIPNPTHSADLPPYSTNKKQASNPTKLDYSF